jgi:hypothetical protein
MVRGIKGHDVPSQVRRLGWGFYKSGLLAKRRSDAQQVSLDHIAHPRVVNLLKTNPWDLGARLHARLIRRF